MNNIQKHFSVVALCAAFMFFTAFASFGQNIIYSCDFEDETENSNWTLANGDQTNQWHIGTAASNGGNGLYISNDGGTTNEYTIEATDNATSTVYAYRSIEFTENTICNVSFDWKSVGEDFYYDDHLLAFIVPSDLDISEASNIYVNSFNIYDDTRHGIVQGVPSGWINICLNNNVLYGSNSWQTNSKNMLIVSGTYNLVFLWQNNNIFGNNPPAAVDNISIVKIASTTLPYTCDFENDAENTNWTLFNCGEFIGWYIGTGANYGGEKSMYISGDNGATNEYFENDHLYSYMYAYREINITETNEYKIDFDWRAYGENTYESSVSYTLLRAFLVPASTNPNLNECNDNGMSSYNNETPSGWIDVSSSEDGLMHGKLDWQHSAKVLNLNAGTYYLVFFWKNDYYILDPPAAVDNIKIRSFTSPAVATVDVSSIDRGAFNATLHGELLSQGASDVTERGFEYGTDSTNLTWRVISTDNTDVFSYEITGLEENTKYYHRAYATNSAGTDYGVIRSFKTHSSLNGHTFVDLGLESGNMWAAANVGATHPDDYGDYFAWAETSAKDTYSWTTYRYCNGSYETLTKYCDDESLGYDNYTDTLTILEAIDDAATTNWGGKWKMPGEDEYDDLFGNCYYKWTTHNGVNGYLLTGPNGNSIFLPAAGKRSGSTLSYAGTQGCYWLNILQWGEGAQDFYFGAGDGNNHNYYSDRYYGQSVRAVFKASPTVETKSATDVEPTTATLQGKILFAEDATVTNRGFLFGTDSEDLAQNFTSNNSTDNFTYSVSDLTANTTYYFKAYATINSETKYGEVKSFRTPSGQAITHFPWTEGFENGLDNWTLIDSDADGYNWHLYESSSAAHKGNYSARSNSYENEVGGLYPCNWLISPAIDLSQLEAPINMLYYVKGLDVSFPEEHYKVCVSTSTDTSTFTIIHEETLPTAEGGSWTIRNIDLSDYSGQVIYLAFVHYNVSDKFAILIDDIYVFTPAQEKDILSFSFDGQVGESIIDSENHTILAYAAWDYDLTTYIFPRIAILPSASISPESGDGVNFSNPVVYTVTGSDASTQQWTVTILNDPNACPNPEAIVASNTGNGTATISWEQRYHETSYNVKVSTTEMADMSATADIFDDVVNNISLDLTGLVGNTTYYVYVQSLCANAEGWTSSSFTHYNPFSYMYICDFEDDTENANWTLSNGDQTNKWHIGTAANNGGSNGLYISNNGGESNIYSTNVASNVYAYRTIPITNNSYYNISFDLRTQGGDDYLVVFLAPTLAEQTPSAGTLLTGTPDDWIFIDAFANQDSWQNYNTQVELEEGDYNLIFYWTNYGENGVNPPAAIDNINITPRVIDVATNSATDVTNSSAILHGGIITQPDSEIKERGFLYGTNRGNLTENVASTDETYIFSSEITGLAENTTYYYRAYAINNDGAGYGEIMSFRTYGNINDHLFVDLGLPSGTKWATCNVGATNPEGYGNYYAWGETTTKSSYDWSTYTHCNGSSRTLTKYCTNSDYGDNGFTDNLTTLEAEDDAATANWGNGWRMPTHEEMNELKSNCSSEYTSYNGVYGYLYTGPNGNSIFLPTAGLYSGSSFSSYSFVYPTSSIDQEEPMYVFAMSGHTDRQLGVPVRAVYRMSPTVATNSPTNITPATAIMHGSISNSGNSEIIERGFVYGTNKENLNNTIQDETGTTEFSYSLTGLISDKTYYYRAYATNSDETAYGEIYFFTTPSGQLGEYCYVDLGLPSKTMWANINVGATNAEDIGGGFAWGETTVKDNYDWSNYIHCNGSSNTLTKYCSDSDYGYNGFTDDLTILEATDDAAAVIWGDEWLMPTAEDIQELIDNCDTAWIVFNEVKGVLATSINNGNSIFLPVSYNYNEEFVNIRYWSSSLYLDNSAAATCLYIDTGNPDDSPAFYASEQGRYSLAPIRPVYKFVPEAFVVGDDPYNCGFEDADENANWILSNGNELNRWYIGTGANNGGNKGLYISNDRGTTNAYDNGSTSYVYAYREINIEDSATYYVQFDWRANGEEGWDVMRAFIVPSSSITDLTAGTSNGMEYDYNTAPDKWINCGDNETFSGNSGWQHSYTEVSLESATYYLVFFWKNDDDYGSNPSAAIDNISIKKVNCPMVADITVTEITTESATISWTERGAATSWEIIVSEDELNSDDLEATDPTATVSSPSYSATGLTFATTYYVYVRTICSDTENSNWKSYSFNTSICDAGDLCNITYLLTDSYGDGWNGNAINVIDEETGIILGTWTIEDGSSASGTLAVCDGREIIFEYVEGDYADETSYQVYYSNGTEVFSGEGAMDSPLSYIIECPPPVEATTQRATSLATSATLAGELVFDRIATVTQVGFEYGESEDQLTETETMAYSENAFTKQITGLTPQTIYYYRAFAIYNNDIRTYGDVVSFRTKQNDTDGTADNPLTIESAEEWAQFGEAMYLSENQATATYKGFEVYNSGEDVYFELTADIDISVYDAYINFFSGYLKGNGNTIQSKNPIFTTINNGSVDNLNIIITESIALREHEVYIPFGVVCTTANSATISNCTVSGATADVLINASYLGDLAVIAAQSNNSTITNCVNNLPITNDRIYAVGIVATINGGSVTGCINNAALTGIYASGIVGSITGGTLSSNLNTGKIIGEEGASGILYEAKSGNVVVDGCMNTGEVYSTEKNRELTTTGGIVATNDVASLSISNCANYGSFSNLSAHIGGIFGNGVAQLSSNISAPIFIENSVEGNPYNSVYATIGTDAEHFSNDITEEDDFFDEQISDLRVDSLRLRYASRGTGMPTSEVVGTALQASLSTNWTYTAGLLPMPAGIPEDDRTTLARIPIYLAENDKSGALRNNFTVPTSILGHDVTWESSNTNVISITDGNATVTRPAEGEASEEVTITATYEGETRSFVLRIIPPKSVPVSTEDPDVGDTVYLYGYIDPDNENLSYLTEYGFIYGTQSDISDATEIVCTYLDEWGYFYYELEGLEEGRTYYVAAFASTADTTTYGEIKEFRIPGPPEIIIGCPLYRTTTTMEIKILDAASDDEYEPNVIMYYGTVRNNLTENVPILYENDYHYLYADFENLQPETEYWFVAEISDNYGTSHSDTVAYYTYGTFTDDRDNNEYYTIKIGDQTWMAQNLRFEGITLATEDIYSYETAYRYYVEGMDDIADTYGYLYNWPAIMNGEESSDKNPSGVQGICPEGWHLPSDAEWNELKESLGGDNNDDGSQLAGQRTYWETSNLTRSPNFGTSGFEALPTDEETSAYFWSATEFDTNGANNYWIYTSYTSLNSGTTHKSSANSVRCIKGTTYYVYDTIPYCGTQYAYHDTIITASGDYTVRRQIEENNENVYYLHLTMYPALTATISSFSNGCFGASNGFVEVSATGGAGTYTYRWDTPNAQTNARLENVGAGEYVVMVSDAAGCTTTVSHTLIEPDALTTSLNAGEIGCNGGTTNITGTYNGGTSPYAYSWSNGATSQNLTDVTAGNYSVVVTDNNGCTAEASVTITQPNALTVSLSANDILCNAGTTTITSNVNGGTSPYAFSWSNGGTSQNLTGVTAGNYSVVVTDNNGCTASASITITQPNALTASLTAGEIGCNGGTTSITGTFNGGTSPYAYSWSNDATSQNLTNVTAGDYSVVVTDNNGCTAEASVTITQPNALTASLTAGEIGCNDGTTNITNTVNGGTSPYSYSWSNSATSQNLTNVTAGDYSVVVTDNNGCTAEASVTITQPNALTVSLSATDILCNSGTTNITNNVNGGTSPYNYSWSNGATTQNLTDVTAGNYSVVVTDNNGCTASAGITITQPNAISVSFGNTVSQTCAALGSIEFTISGGTGTISYAWDDGNAIEYSSATTSNLTSGEHTISITDANGCTKTDNVEIGSDTDAPNVQISSSTTTLTCSVNSILLQASGAISYQWSDGSTESTLTAESTGIYMVTGTATNGCTATASVVITSDIEAPTVSIVNTNNPETTELTCEISSINVQAVGSDRVVSYSWSGGTYTNQASNELTAAGTYTVTATADNGCVATDQITITETTDRPHVEINAASTILTCATTNLTLTASGDAVSYTWSGGNPNGAENVVEEPDTYTVIASAANGCTAISSITITEDITAPVVSISNETGTSVINCSVSQIDVTASGDGITSYVWADNQNNPSFSITSAGTYTVTATGENGCTSTSSVEITQDFAAPQVAVSASPEIVCLGSSTTLTATGAVSYQWAPETDLSATTGSEVTATPSATTEYIVTGTGTNGCTASTNLTVTVSAQVTSEFEQSSCYSFEWNGQTYTESGNYEQTLQTVNGCDSIVTMHLTINNSTTGEFVDQMCSGVPYEYNGQTFAEAGTYEVTLVNANGCDSVVTLTLTYADNCNGIISGVITDDYTGDLIPNARVTIGNNVTYTNAEGQYSLEVLRGRKTLRVSAVEYISHSEIVDVQGDTTFNIALNSPRIITSDNISLTTYPYLEQTDTITITNTGNGTLVWSSITEYDDLALVEDSTIQRRNSRSLWDSIQTFATRENAEQAVATDGFFIYTSSWMRPGEFNRYTPNGEYVETFFIENVGMIRNLSYNGNYFYGTDATNVIYKLDLDNQTLLGSIETDIPEIRHCSFNRLDGSILAGDWNSLYRIDTTSGTSQQIRSDLANVYSSAFDNLSAGGPYLWLFSQTSQDNGPSACIRQFDISANDFTDKIHYLDDIEISDASLAGGICASEYVCEGKFVLLANVQNPSGNNTIATYEIGRTNSVARAERKSGAIAPNESESIPVRAFATETGDYSSTIRYRAAVMGRQSNDVVVNISAVAPECDAVQQITATTDNSAIILEWSPVELGEYNNVSYLVYNTASQFAIDTLSETSATYRGLPNGEHCFYVRALSSAGYTCMSEASDTVCAEIKDSPCDIPLFVEARSDGETITVSWNPPADVDHFSIYRDSESLAENLTTTNFVDTDVVAETDYCYTVVAHLDNALCDEISETTCMRILTGVCTEAPVLTADAIGNSVILKWTECEGAVSYRIFRDDEFLGSTNGTSYSDSPKFAGNYCYVVESDCEHRMYEVSNEECVSADAIDEWSADNITLYPNPTYSQFFIEGQHIATVQIFNAIGQLVAEIENNESEHITINCDGWNPGLYNVLLISTEGEIATKKVTIFR